MGTPGIDEARVSRWLADEVGLVAPLSFALVAGGRSNLTFRVEDANGSAVALRRPPVSHVLPTAHDMVREHTVISALGPTGVPVPEALALCLDDEVTGAPFYVMEFVEGAILRDRATAEALVPEADRGEIGPSLARTLAGLHAVDVDAAGLGALARRDGYAERQLRRWRAQYEQTRDAGEESPGLVESVAAALAADVPAAQRVAVVHGDYRLDNTVLGPDGSVRAILDWEICTLGDPLADVGLFLDYWAEPSDPTAPLLGAAPTTAPGFAARDDVLDAYAGASDLDLSDVAYWRAFGYWKLACILQGVYARYRAGATAGDPGSVAEFPRHITLLAQMALETVEH
ncbi:MAG TPA: phosphotransferase family protein [Acidimicrobiales bacterium]|nr:phosphotransferase family protein [Acidimicrobiales bacterium]